MELFESADTPTDRRFEGVIQLYGLKNFERIRSARVLIVGLGGVGSWVVEALARTGIGGLVLVDMDEVCISNVNRQIQALPSTVGRSKAQLLAQRIREINDRCDVQIINKFFSEKTAEEIFSYGPTIVVDAIDRVTNKALLIAEAVSRSLPIVTTGSAGNREDPSTIRVADLSRTIHDPLLSYVRRRLRTEHGFPKHERKKFNVPCVYAPRQKNGGFIRPSDTPHCDAEARSCNDGMGTVSFMTGSVGFFAAGEVIKQIVSED